MGSLRRYLLAGLAVTIPTVVTLFILGRIYQLLQDQVGERAERYLVAHVSWIAPDQAWASVTVGAVLTLVLLVVVGWISSTVFGRRLVALGERVVQRVPVVGWIYAPARQLVTLLFGAKQVAFRRVVLVAYPRPGCYCIGFVTAEPMEETRRRTGSELVNVFVPFSPTPVTGILLLVPRDELVEVDYSVEEGMKLVISGGVLTPDSARLAGHGHGPIQMGA